MARVIVDASAIGEPWFADIVGELMRSPAVLLVAGADGKTAEEHRKAKKLAELYRIMDKKGQVRRVPAGDVDKSIAYLEALPVWIGEAECDDAHLFAAVYHAAVRYIFTRDARLAGCRDCINKVVDNAFCQFSLIRSAANYGNARLDVLR